MSEKLSEETKALIDLVIERAEQACRYAVKHQDFSHDDDGGKRQEAWEIAAEVCEAAIRPHVERHIANDLATRAEARPVTGMERGGLIDPKRIREVVAEDDGFWRTCSGCHEAEDGHDVGHYPFSPEMGCTLGGGCGECGGLGAIWDGTDYTGFGDAPEEARPAPAVDREAVEAKVLAAAQEARSRYRYSAPNPQRASDALFRGEPGPWIAIAKAVTEALLSPATSPGEEKP